jgi:RecJ-like exonuclease
LLLVVWTYEDACWGYLNGNKDIIQKRCNICDGTSATTEYLHVNSTADDDEIAPSVASRHSPSSFYNALYTYSDPANTNDVYYVTSYFANSPIRIAGGNKSVRVIVKPNPTSDKLEVKSDSDQKIYLIKLIDMQSKIFIEETVNALEKSIDVSSIKNGIYLLTLDFEDGSKVNYKVIISH